jgi:hypothetical protein
MTIATKSFGKHRLKAGIATNKRGSPSARKRFASTRFLCNGYVGKVKELEPVNFVTRTPPTRDNLNSWGFR